MKRTDFIYLNPGQYFQETKEGIYCHLASLRIVLKFLDTDGYHDLSNTGRSGIINIDPKIKLGKKFITEREVSKAFRAIFGELSDLIDILLAYIELIGTIRVHPNWTKEEATEYCENKIYEGALSISRDIKRTFPSKCNDLGLDHDLKEKLLGLNDIRVALEHHKSIPKKDIKLITNVQYSEDQHGRKFVDFLPQITLSKELKIKTKFKTIKITKKKNEYIDLKESDIERLCEMIEFQLLQQIHDHFVDVLEEKVKKYKHTI